jgi:UPF0755 protein
MSDGSDKGGEAKKPDDGASKPRVSLFGGRSRAPEEKPDKSEKRPPKRRRRVGLSSFSGFLSFALLGVVCGLGLFAWAMMEARRPGPLAADKVVVVAREDDGGPIGDQLERAGVIDSSLWFAAMTLMDGSRSALKRGEYAFKAGVSLREVEAELVAHKVVLHSITIPEGLTSDQVVQRVRDNDALVGDVKETPAEGAILPETYKFALGETRQAILAVMVKAQAKTVDEIWKNRAPDLPIKSPGELVTLASIVEKETGKPDERARVAGVFVNRLQRHMKLQSDPTIVYGLVYGKGVLGHSITKAELEQSTRYNTYIIDGLPPGPICNPGKAALEAAANPARGKELYFVADGTGGHAFAETFDQHQKNVAHWREVDKEAKERLSPDIPPIPATPATPTTPAAAPPAKRSDLAPVDPRTFGAMAFDAGPSTADAGPLADKLSKLGESRRLRDALIGAGGALSANNTNGKTLEGLGAVVTGVNDAPEGAAFAIDDDPGATAGAIASAPLSASALADEKARIARYGESAAGDGRVAGLDAAPPSTPRVIRVYDASEGTPLDPLLNKTYDLNYAKTVPPLGAN